MDSDKHAGHGASTLSNKQGKLQPCTLISMEATGQAHYLVQAPGIYSVSWGFVLLHSQFIINWKYVKDLDIFLEVLIIKIHTLVWLPVDF